MRLRPDFNSTATGYHWLDRFTFPYWRFRVWYEHRKFVKAIEQVDEWIEGLEHARESLDVWEGGVGLLNEGFVDTFDYDGEDFDFSPWGTESYLEPWIPEPPDHTRPRDERP